MSTVPTCYNCGYYQATLIATLVDRDTILVCDNCSDTLTAKGIVRLLDPIAD